MIEKSQQEFSHPYRPITQTDALLLVPSGGAVYASRDKNDLQPVITTDVFNMITNAEHLILNAETSIVCLEGYGERYYVRLDAVKVEKHLSNLKNKNQ
mgnify:CR=1 FL=1